MLLVEPQVEDDKFSDTQLNRRVPYVTLPLRRRFFCVVVLIREKTGASGIIMSVPGIEPQAVW